MSDDLARELSLEFHETLLETLKLLNRAEEEEEAGEGLEPAELLFLLRKGPSPNLGEADLLRALETLLANRMVDPKDDPEYAWDRGRILGRRFTINTAGKTYLLAQIEKTGRIG